MKPIALSSEAASLPKTSLPGAAVGASAQAPFDLLFALIAPVAAAAPTDGESADFLPVSGELADAAPQVAAELMTEETPEDGDETAFFAPVFDFMQQAMAPIAAPALPIAPLSRAGEGDGDEIVLPPDMVLDDVALAGLELTATAPKVTPPSAPVMPAPQGPEVGAMAKVPSPEPWMVETEAMPVPTQSLRGVVEKPFAAMPLPAQGGVLAEAAAEMPAPNEALLAQQTAAPEEVMAFEAEALNAPNESPGFPVSEAQALVAAALPRAAGVTIPTPTEKAAVPPASPLPATAPTTPQVAAPAAQSAPAKPATQALRVAKDAPAPLAADAPTEADVDLPIAPVADKPAPVARSAPPIASPLAEAVTRAETTVSDLTQAPEFRPAPEFAAAQLSQEPMPKPEAHMTGGAVQAVDAPTQVRAPSPAAPPPPGAPLPGTALNMRQNDWGRQLLDRIERISRDGSEAFEISLRPKTLGALRINLEVQGERTSVHFVTETASAARMLLGSEDKLSQLLDQSGFRLGGFSAYGGGAGGQNGHPQPQKERTTIRTGKRVGAATPETPQPAPAQGTGGAGVNMLA